jgi:hypothetical protein
MISFAFAGVPDADALSAGARFPALFDRPARADQRTLNGVRDLDG